MKRVLPVLLCAPILLVAALVSAEPRSRVRPATTKRLARVYFTDIDGVLLRRPHARRQMMAKALRQYGVRIAPDALDTTIYPADGMKQKVMRGEISASTFLRHVNGRLRPFGLQRDLTLVEFWQANLPGRAANPKMRRFMAKLRNRNIPRGILSDRLVGDVAYVMAKVRENFPRMFADPVLRLHSCEHGMTKFDPAFYDRARERVRQKYGVDAEETIFVDDNAAVIKMAKKAGFRTVHYQFFDQEAPDIEAYPTFRELLSGVTL